MNTLFVPCIQYITPKQKSGHTPYVGLAQKKITLEAITAIETRKPLGIALTTYRYHRVRTIQ